MGKEKYLNILIVFVLVNFAWIFFRSDTISHAFNYIYYVFQFDFSFNLVQICAEKDINLLISLLAILSLYLSYLLPRNLTFDKPIKSVIFNVLAILIIFSLGVNGESEFIYFQF